MNEKWQLVPREPTAEMAGFLKEHDVYSELLAAAPVPTEWIRQAHDLLNELMGEVATLLVKASLRQDPDESQLAVNEARAALLAHFAGVADRGMV